MSHLIHTEVKQKLKSGLSYPLGATIVSENLSGIPQYKVLGLCFYGRQGNRFGSFVPDSSVMFTRLKRAEAHFHRLYQFREVMIGRWWDDCWSIAIFGVESRMRQVAKIVLTARALPALKGWLCEKRPETWFEGKRRL